MELSSIEKSKLSTLWEYLFSKYLGQEKDTKIEILKNIPIFKELSKRELKIISRIVYERRYESGEFIFEMGQPGAAMFVIETGEVDVVLPQENEKKIVLATLREGEFFGELALLDDSPRSASAECKSDLHALALFRDDLHKLLANYPEIGVKVMKHLAITIGYRLKATNDLLMRQPEKKNED